MTLSAYFLGMLIVLESRVASRDVSADQLHALRSAGPLGELMTGLQSTCSEETEFQCVTSGECLSLSVVCNAEPDCEDESDELGCMSVRKTCIEFRCKNQRCIPKDWACDGSNDCSDNSDEIGCGVSSLCSNGQHLCDGDQCLPHSWRCDGNKDCRDESDEKGCDTARLSGK